MAKKPFEVGDWVRCVDPVGELVLNQRYKILEVITVGEMLYHYVYRVLEHGEPGKGHFPHRFVLDEFMNRVKNAKK